jgi:putative addiction module component (TIGR02574 family)
MASRSRKGKQAHKNVVEPPGFGSLSKAEQIRYLQALWDRISETPGELPLPASHLRLAKERLADYRRDPTRARSPRDVIRRLANRDR